MTKQEQLNDLAKHYIRLIKEISPENAIRFHLSFSYSEIKYGFDLTTPEYLEDIGISMKNIKGERIK